MDLAIYWNRLTTWWFMLPYETQHAAWLATGAILLSLTVLAAYYVFRRLLGYRKFRGAWYTQADFHSLIDALIRDQKESNRVLLHDELRIVQRALHGSGYRPLHKGRYGGYM